MWCCWTTRRRNICKEIVRCGGLDGRVNIALDFFDASINRISAWAVGLPQRAEGAICSALLEPRHDALTMPCRTTQQLHRADGASGGAENFMPFGDVWDEYCRSCNVPVGTDWFETVQKYERDVLSKRV